MGSSYLFFFNGRGKSIHLSEEGSVRRSRWREGERWEVDQKFGHNFCWRGKEFGEGVEREDTRTTTPACMRKKEKHANSAAMLL